MIAAISEHLSQSKYMPRYKYINKAALVISFLITMTLLAVMAAAGVVNYDKLEKALEDNKNLTAISSALFNRSASCEARLEESRLYNRFTAAVEEVSIKPWSKENNCYDHSKLLQQKLKDQGIASSIFITPTRDHAFVGVWVEATTGNLIAPDRYQVGELRDYNLNVICD